MGLSGGQRPQAWGDEAPEIFLLTKERKATAVALKEL